MSVETDLQNTVTAVNNLTQVVLNEVNNRSASVQAAASSAALTAADRAITQALVTSFQSQFLGSFPNDAAAAAFAAAKNIPLTDGIMYQNTTDDKFRQYNGTTWQNYDSSAQAAQSSSALSAVNAAGSAADAATSAAAAAGSATAAASAAATAATNAGNSVLASTSQNVATMAALRNIAIPATRNINLTGYYADGDSSAREFYGVSAPVATFTGTTAGTKPSSGGTYRTLTVSNVTNQIYIGMSVSWAGSPTPVTIIGFVSGVYGGAGVYRISVPTETAANVTNVAMSARFANNNGSIILPNGGDGTSAWFGPKTKIIPVTSASARATEFRGVSGSVSVTDFGAKGDGVTDDTNAIQAALNSAATVEFPSGLVFRVTNTIFLPSNAYLWGGGEIFVDQTPKYLRCFFANPETSNITIDGLNFRGGSGFGMNTPSSAYQSICVGGYYVDNITVKNCSFFDFVGSGGTLVAFVTSNNIKILHNYFDDSNSGYSDMYLGYRVGDTIVDGNVSYSNSDVFLGVADLYEDISSTIDFPNCANHIVTNNIHIKGRWNVPLKDISYATFDGTVSGTVLTVSNVVGTITVGQQIVSKSLPSITLILSQGTAANTWNIVSYSGTLPTISSAEPMQASAGATFTGQITNNVLSITNVQGAVDTTYWISSAVGAALPQGTKVTTSTGIFTGSISGTTLTITAMTGSLLANNTETIMASIGGVTPGTTIVSQITPLNSGEALGGIGRYTISNNLGTLSSRSMYVSNRWNVSSIPSYGEVSASISGTTLTTVSPTGVGPYSPALETARIEVDMPVFGTGVSGATFTGSISGTTLDVPNAPTSGSIVVGQTIVHPSVIPGTVITGGPVSTGGSGTSWTVSVSQNVASTTMQSTTRLAAVNLASLSQTVSPSQTVSGTRMTLGFWPNESLNTPAMSMTAKMPSLGREGINAHYGQGISYLICKGNIIGNTARHGIYLRGNTNGAYDVTGPNIVSDNIMAYCGSGQTWALAYSSGIRVETTIPTVVTNNYVYRTGYFPNGSPGIQAAQDIEFGRGANDLIISENSCVGAKDGAIQMYMTVGPSSTNNVKVIGNTIKNNKFGICLGSNSSQNSYYDVQILNNHITLTGAEYGSTGAYRAAGVFSEVAASLPTKYSLRIIGNTIVGTGRDATFTGTISGNKLTATAITGDIKAGQRLTATTATFTGEQGNGFYQFTVSGITNLPVAGDNYTSGGQTYTIVSATATTIVATGTAALTATTAGTLTRSTGSGDGTIAFSAFACQTGNILKVTSAPTGTILANGSEIVTADTNIILAQITPLLGGEVAGGIGRYRMSSAQAYVSASRTSVSSSLAILSPQARFTATCSGTTLTVTEMGSGVIVPNATASLAPEIYTEAQVMPYDFTVSGVTTLPVAGNIYTIGNASYTIVSATASTIRATGQISPPATGTLTRSTGSGDTTIAYSAEIGIRILSQITPLTTGEVLGGCGRYTISMSFSTNAESLFSTTNIWNLSGPNTNIPSGVSMTSSSQAYGLSLSMAVGSDFTGTSLISQNTMRGLWRGFASWRFQTNGIQYVPHKRIGFETRFESNRFVSCTLGFSASGQTSTTLMILDYSNIFENCATTGVGTTITWGTAVFGRSLGQNTSGQFLAEWTAAASPSAVEQYYVGDMVLNSAPVAGGNVGWVCTTAGTTGAVWQRYGQTTLSGSATYDPPSLLDGAGDTTTVTVTGAALGDYVTGVSFSLNLQGITVTAWVSAANTVSVRFQNETGGTLDLASGTLRVNVMKQ